MKNKERLKLLSEMIEKEPERFKETKILLDEYNLNNKKNNYETSYVIQNGEKIKIKKEYDI